MQVITPQYVHHNVYYEIFKAGTHFKYPDDLSAIKTLQDSYREFIDYDPLDFSQEWKKDGKSFVFGPLGPSYHDLLRLAAKDEDHVTLWKYVSHTTPALPFPPFCPMFIPTWSPAEYCSHCGANMHRTNGCMSHAMQIVQSAARCLKLTGFVFTGPDINQHGKRQRLHAGPGWSHLPTIGYGEVGTMYFETGISGLPNPACVEDSGDTYALPATAEGS